MVFARLNHHLEFYQIHPSDHLLHRHLSRIAQHTLQRILIVDLRFSM